MSLNINWSLLNENLAEKVKLSIQSYIENNRALLPEWISNLSIKSIRWSKEVPEIIIENVAEVPEEFKAKCSTTENSKFEFRSRVSSTFTSDSNPNGTTASNSSISSNRIINSKVESSSKEDAEEVQGKFPANPFDIQLLVSFKYKGNLSLMLDGEIRLNYPTLAFISLPISVKVSSFDISTNASIVFLGSKILFCFLKKEEFIEPHIQMKTEWEVGDADQQQVLRNAAKIEKFFMELMHKFIWDNFVYPNVYTIDLSTSKDFEVD